MLDKKKKKEIIISILPIILKIQIHKMYYKQVKSLTRFISKITSLCLFVAITFRFLRARTNQAAARG